MSSNDSEFSLGVSHALGRVVVEVNGALTADTAPQLHDRLADIVDGHGHRHLVLDLRRMNLIDFAGFLVLVEALKRLQQVDGELVLSGPTRSVTAAFKAAGLDKVFLMTQSWTHPCHGVVSPDRWGIAGAR